MDVDDDAFRSPQAKKHRPCVMQMRNTVKTSKLPFPFMEMTFVGHLEKVRLRNNICVAERHVIVRCMHFKEDSCALVEFTTGEVADKMSDLKEINVPNFGTIAIEKALYSQDTVMNSTNTFINQTLDISQFPSNLKASTPVKDTSISEMLSKLSPFKPKSAKKLNVPQGVEEKNPVVNATDDEELAQALDDEVVPTVKPQSTVPVEVEMRTCKVKIVNLPEDYNETDLIYEIHKKIWKESDIKKPHRPALECSKSSSTEAVVTFDSVESATIAASLSPFPYEDTMVDATQLFTVPVEVEAPTPKVKIVNLPEDYNETELIYEIHKKIWKESDIKKPHRPALECLKSSSTEAVVTFDSVESATIAASLSPFPYEDTMVDASQIYGLPQEHSGFDGNNNKAASHDTHSSSQDTHYVDNESLMHDHAMKDSSCVKISGLPETFSEKNFCTFIKESMIKANFLEPDSLDPIERIRSDDGSVFVVFTDSHLAALACLLEGLKFSGRKIIITKFSEEFQEEQLPEEASFNIPLDSDTGREIFLKLLIKHRHDFPKSGPHDTVLESLRKKLARKGVCATLNDVRGARRKLRERYRSHVREGKTNGRFFTPCAVIFDEHNVSDLSGTDFDPDLEDEDNPDEVEEHDEKDYRKYCSTAVWTTNATLALIDVCASKREEFLYPDGKSRATTFWKNVHLDMAAKKYYYTEAQCKSKMDDLRCAHKDYMQAGGSGTPSIAVRIPNEGQRSIMQDMCNLMEGCVAVEPKCTISSGYVSGVKTATGSSNCDTSKKARPTVLKRPPFLAQQKHDLNVRKVAAFEQFLLERSARKKDAAEKP